MRAVHVTAFAFAARGNLAFADDARAAAAARLARPDHTVSLVVAPRAFPYVLGSDVCVVVVAVGAQCTRFRVGDRIVASQPPFVHGSFADLVLVGESLMAMAPPPSVWGALEIASLPVAGCTALQAIKDARIGPGSRVLAVGGSGGVGTLVIQLTKLKGAAFVATTPANAALVKSLGADLVIDYRHANWWDVLHQRREAHLDGVIDCVSDAASWQHCDARVLQMSGRYIAVVDAPDTEVRTIWGLLAFVGPLLWRSINPFTTSYKMVSSFPRDEHVQELVELVTANPESLRAVLDPASTFAFSLEDVTQAVALQNSRRAKGKLVFEVNSE